MTEKTFYRMTKKRPIRRVFALFVAKLRKYLNVQRFFEILAKIKLIKEVSKSYEYPVPLPITGKVSLADHITTDRGVFSTSYYTTVTKVELKHWYETKFTSKPRKLYEVCTVPVFRILAQVRAQCEEFEVRFDPFNHVKVNKMTRVVPTFAPEPRILDFSPSSLEVKTKTINMLDARLAVNVENSIAEPISQDDLSKIVLECVRKANTQIRDFIENNPSEINYKLTGVKNDGDFISPFGYGLMPNCICYHCGFPVFKEPSSHHSYCVRCDRILHLGEFDRVDPITYKDRYKNCRLEIYYLLNVHSAKAVSPLGDITHK